MAKMAELSKQRFSHLFKEQLGKAPMTYLKELRLTTAARKLLVTNDIAWGMKTRIILRENLNTHLDIHQINTEKQREISIKE